MLVRDRIQGLQPGIKLAVQILAEPTADDLTFVRQLGIKYVTMWTRGPDCTPEYYVRCRKMIADAGLTLYGFGNTAVHNQDAIVLNLANRDDKVEEYKAHLRNLAQAGIPYTTYAHMANGIWSTEREESRGASARAFDLAKAEVGQWDGVQYGVPLSHGRVYAEDEIWENYAYFIRAVAPIAEELGILIGIHPDDPPVPELAGIPRCIFQRLN